VQRSDLALPDRVYKLLVASIFAAMLMIIVALYEKKDTPQQAIGEPGIQPTIVVAIEGAVGTPGVYELPGGSRVQHVISAAGGLTGSADLAAVNPATPLEDGERVIVPFKPTPVPIAQSNGTGPDAQSGSSETSGLLNINTASADELDELPGIGEVIAERIVAYRETNGAFSTVDELAEVSGISERMVEELRPLITAGP
jgi:competence protein ComEA